MSERIHGTQAEEKISRVREVFSKLKVPVRIREVSVPGLNKYAVVVKGKVEGYLEPEKRSYEELLALTTYETFKGLWRTIRKHAADKEKLARRAYYYLVGYLGASIMTDIPEETRRIPTWFKRLPVLSPLSVFSPSSGFFVDHPFYSRDGEYISEPYDMSMEDFENLIKFCREHGLRFTVRGESRHFPGHTFRVIIEPEEKR